MDRLKPWVSDTQENWGYKESEAKDFLHSRTIFTQIFLDLSPMVANLSDVV